MSSLSIQTQKRHRERLLVGAKTVIVKVGTSVVSHRGGHVALGRLGYIVEQIAWLMSEGRQVILVTSGSVGIGRQKLRHQTMMSSSLRSHLHDQFRRPEDSEMDARACAAAGQSGLMALYESLFAHYDISCSQILVTDDDFASLARRQNVRDTISNLMRLGILPIINENDVVSTRSTPIRDADSRIFWDNDSLASLIGTEMAVDALIVLSDVDGLYVRPPAYDGEPVEVIHTFSEEATFAIGEKSRVGRGGMQAKIAAAKSASDAGVRAVVIGNGYKADTIRRIMSGELIGTLLSKFTVDTALDRTPSPPSAEEKYLVMATDAREASRALLKLSTEERGHILLKIAENLRANKDSIAIANEIDLKEATAAGISQTLISRLKLDSEKIETLCHGIESLGRLHEDPVFAVLGETEVSSDLLLQKVSVPIGVLLVIFESRPDALPQIASLAIRTGNSVILKGGKEAVNTNTALQKLIQDAIGSVTGTSPAERAVALVHDREAVSRLLKLDKDIDLVIPRGSSDLVRQIQSSTKIPVLGHSEGICHIYVDEEYDMETAKRLIVDAKTSYPSACNAVETILVHESLFRDSAVKELVALLEKENVTVHVGPEAAKTFPNLPRTDCFHREYGDLQVTLEAVKSVQHAIQHINLNGSSHTDSIITKNQRNAALFLQGVDSACVFHNASTRFADGYRFGLGAEVGISTSRIHARGPVGMEGLLTYKWKLVSSAAGGHAVTDFSTGRYVYTHRPVKSNL